MTTPTFTAPPTAPARSDSDAVFVSRADAFVAWFATLYAELVTAVAWFVTTAAQTAANAVSTAADAVTSAAYAAAAATSAVGSSGYMRRSTASLTIGTGAKAVTGLQTPSVASFANGDEAILIDAGDGNNRMWGVVSSANMAAGTMTVTVASGAFAGSGTITNWIVMLRAFEDLPAATAAEILAASINVKTITPAGWKAALVRFALTDGATVTPSGASGLDFSWTIAGNRTLAAITNTYPGARGSIEITQDGTGSRILAWAAVWKRSGGLPVLSTAASAKDYIQYEVVTVDGSNVATLIIAGFSRAPSNS